jgi:two-component system chemotaxis response regulator CheB
MATLPTPILVVTSHHDPRDVALSLRAVNAGALTVAPKPVGPGSVGFAEEAARFVRLVKALAGVRPVRRRNPEVDSAPLVLGPLPDAVPPRVLAVAASTGGPAALYRLLELLPARLGVPVLVVQHIAEGFAAGLASWLTTAGPLPVKLAADGERLSPGMVYVAPGGRHLEVQRSNQVRLTESPPVAGFRPSASVLFGSVADAYGAAGVAVVLTGMGEDGLVGARRLRAAGAAVLAQDERSSVVFGMPRAISDAGLATSVGTVEELAAELSHVLPTRKGKPR